MADPVPDRELLVLWGNTPWDGHRLGAQFLAEALSHRHAVLFVDPPTSVLRLGWPGSPLWRAHVGRGLQHVGPNLWRVRTVGPPGIRRRLVRPATAAIVRRRVRRAVRRLGRPVRAVISGYLDADPFGCCDERWRICRVSDDFTTGSELGIRVARTAAAQERIAERADAVVCVSQPLADRWSARGLRTVLIPNGSDTHRLRTVRELPRPPGIRLPDPLVGYVGQLSVRIDLDLLAAVADAGHSLLLVGGLRPDLHRSALEPLLSRPNVQWLGERPYAEIPALLGTIAVGLLPYAATEFNRASFPLKLLEYLGAGVGPVATDLPAVRWLDSDLVRVAGDPASFVAAVDDALAHADDAAERTARVELAARHDWSRRAADYVDLLDQLDADAAHRGGSQSAAP